MRLHTLRIEAFGPFAGRADVDLDTLGEAGLFLLSGPTGAGKTSVLDSVCFALYGAVPGIRNDAGGLRADQAAPGAVPRVTLEVTLQQRRFRIVRSPGWQRPKKRGTGTTTERASVTMSELVAGQWEVLSSRNDEVGDLVARLTGLTMTQFIQVVMLPQGQFQRFLHSSSDERKALLERIFRTERFAAVEAWLREHRTVIARQSAEIEECVAALANRVSEVAQQPVPDAWHEQPGGSAATEALTTWVHQAGHDADAQAARSAAAAVIALDHAQECARIRDRARADAERRAGWRRAHDELRRLELSAADHRDDVRRLGDARRAVGVRPAHIQRDAAQVAAERAAQAAAALRESTAHDLSRLQTAFDERRATLPEQLQAAEREVEACRIAEARVPGLRAAWESAQAVVEAHDRLTTLRPRLLSEREAHVAAGQMRNTLKERVNDLRGARIAGMAAELAGQLVVGGDCPVCGSVEHPHKAVSAPDAPDQLAEQQLVHDLDDAELELEARADAMRNTAMLVDRYVEIAGSLTAEQAAEQLGRSTAELEKARASAAGLAAAMASRDQLADAIESLDAELAEQRSALSERLARAEADEHAAAAAAEQAEASLAAVLVESAFADVDAAEAAWRSPSDIDGLAQSVEEYGQRMVEVQTRLSDLDPEIFAAPEPDLVALTAAARDAEQASVTARTRADAAARCFARLSRLIADLRTEVDLWAPLRERLAVATRMAQFAEGKATDNRERMRLSAYVLAYRLSQVVAAANQRLAAMSGHRYSLQHTIERGAGETRGGLSLAVRDDWSGQDRAPGTLSGGETFVVSLALALGLADVVRYEAGGAQLDTLFVDEGFGSLDADTLDDVLDTIDGLREGGRVVGVVSHVAEMRDRIPTQLVVTPSTTGSTLSIK